MVKCPNCGANVSSRDQACSYCGTANPDYIPPGDEVNTLLEKAMDAYQHKRYALAIDCYNQIIGLDPDVFSAYFYLAASLTVLGRREEAIEAMQKARDIRPGSTAVYFNLGLLCKQVGHKAEAQTYLEEAQKMAGSDSSIKNRDQFKRNVTKELAELER
jgi:tetratricopeptide (TPR) repeat protein